jgi:hypothetical protein
MTDVHLGDELTVLRFYIKEKGVAVNCSSGSAQLKIRKKDKTVIYRDMQYFTDGADGIFDYVTTGSDFDEGKGSWIGQIRLYLPGVWYGHTSKAEIEVDDNVDT